MRWYGQALTLVGAFSVSLAAAAQGQTPSYIDLEAEQSQPPGTTRPADPYSDRPASAYPATSYGVNTAPTAPSTVDSSAALGGTAAATAGASGNNLGAVLYQLQQLQREVMMLNGKVEEQAHELRTLKEQNLERYLDLDRRLGATAGGAAAGGSMPTTGGGSTAAAGGGNTPAGTGGAEQPGEGDAYRAAYALVRSQQFDDAVAAFKQFLLNYPDGRYAPNAHYWLGELYLVVTPQDLEASRQSFSLLLSQYPDNPKVPDALFKLGKVQFLKGNRDRSQEYLDRLISEYGSSNSSAVKLAKDFLAENF